MAILDQRLTGRYAIYNGDAMEVMAGLPTASVHLSIYSPPFGGMLYQYSSDPADLSNTKDYAEFFGQYGFFVREIHRLTMPGRMSAVHCQDVAVPKGDDHHLIDFPGDIIRCHEANGWKYVARFHVWKEPLTVRNRTMVKSLHHKTLCLDSTKCSAANADTLLIFRRSGKNPVPVDHPTGLMNYAGSRPVPEEILQFRGWKGNQIENQYSQWVWRQYASAFWDDVRIDRTLGSGAGLYSANKADKDEADEKHMHPLQLDVIERACVMWSNPGEAVLTPFMGVGSEVYGAVLNGRRGVGIELKPAYYRQALANLESLESASDPASPAPADEAGAQRSFLDDFYDPAETVANPSLAPDPAIDPAPGQSSFLPDDDATPDPWPPGTPVFVCNRCHARREAVLGHPCPDCGCPEFGIYAVPEGGYPPASVSVRTGPTVSAGPPEVPGSSPGPDPAAESFRLAVEGKPWSEAWDNLAALGVDQGRYGEFLMAWRGGVHAMLAAQFGARVESEAKGVA